MLGQFHNDFIVYALIDAQLHQIRYVGSTTKGLMRPLSYRDYAHNQELAAWLRDLENRRQAYVILILGRSGSEEHLRALEAHWISEGISHGWPLTNKMHPVDTIGESQKMLPGKRWSMKEWRRDPEVRERLRQAKDKNRNRNKPSGV